MGGGFRLRGVSTFGLCSWNATGLDERQPGREAPLIAAKDLLPPAGQAPNLKSELRADVAHEAGELL